MSGNSITMRDPIAFFITWPTYGTWLPGDERGWVVYTSASRTIATGAVELVAEGGSTRYNWTEDSLN